MIATFETYQKVYYGFCTTENDDKGLTNMDKMNSKIEELEAERNRNWVKTVHLFI